MKTIMTMKHALATGAVAAAFFAGVASDCPCAGNAPACAKMCAAGVYPDRIEEGFYSLFDGETFLNFEGDVDAFGFERNPVVGYMGRGETRRPFCSDVNAIVFKPQADGKPRAIYTKLEYGDFVMRFEYLDATNACGGVGLRTPLKACPCKDGVMVSFADYRDRTKEGRWNFMEVRAIGGTVTAFLNGEKLFEKTVRPANGRIVLVGVDREIKWMRPRVKRVCPKWKADACPKLNKAPAGFTALFDGKTLANWKGVTREEDFDRPWVRQRATPEKRAAMQAKADELMRKFWHVREGALFFDGKKGGYSLATAKDYKDFELWCDWRLQNVQGDSGLYPRGVCQIQIWDAHDMWHLGSGGLYNNKANPRHAMEIADNPVGDWNRFHVKMVGDRVTVWLNGKLVVDNIVLENANEKKFPGPIPACEQLELQCHGDPLEFRNIFIREL